MNNPLVLALDIGTSSVRALLFDARGREVAAAKDGTAVEAHVAYGQNTTADGGVEVDAEKLLALAVRCLKQALTTAGPLKSRIAGVGVSCFWHSLLGVGVDKRAVTPVYSWADTRSGGHVGALRGKLDAVAYHARTGCELHPSYWPAKLLWLHDNGGKRVTQWMGFGEYLFLRLFGKAEMSLSMASGTGLFHQAHANWDATALGAIGIDASALPALCDRFAAARGPVDEFQRTLGVLAGVPWFPALGDGACSNAGSGANDAHRIALNVGTSAAMRVTAPVPTGRAAAAGLHIEPGLFCYRVDAGSAVFGGAFANGGNTHAWLRSVLRWDDGDAVESQVRRMAPDSHGLTILPFWSGERSPGWHGNARATISGMNLHTTPSDVVRATLEACAYSYDGVRKLLQQRFPDALEIVASGGALVHDPVWTQIMADVFGTTIVTSKVAEASSRGAALLALNSLGLLKDVAAAPFAAGRTFHPDPEKHKIYAEASQRYGLMYKKFLVDS